jgi:hypothetical protein
MLKSVQRDFALTLALLVAAAALLVAVVRDLGGGLPAWPAADPSESKSTIPLPLTGVDSLFAVGALPSLATPADQWNGFFTTHFQPPTKPPPKAPTTRKVELTYLGFMQAGDGPRRALVQSGTAQWLGGIGEKVVADLQVAAIETGFLILTNATGATNRLGFRAKTPLEVPIQ